jgi:pimeloyl-ACP methyl ester carboxylesterase
MKLALLLPGYLNSPDYLNMVTIEKRLINLNYIVIRVDACNLWESGDVNKYSTTNYLKQISEIISSYKTKNVEEIVLVGHSLGGVVAIIAGNKNKEVSKVIALCPGVAFSKSRNKYIETGFRQSLKDVPNIPQGQRVFNIPISFIDDFDKYSIPKYLRKLKKPLMVLIATDDKKVSAIDIENAMKYANNPKIIRISGISHGFRESYQEADKVANEVEKYLSL